MVPLAACASAALGGRAARTAALAVALLLLGGSTDRVTSLPMALRMAGSMPPHSRFTLDESALYHACGDSRALRALGLAALHAGPMYILTLCFQIGAVLATIAPRDHPLVHLPF